MKLDVVLNGTSENLYSKMGLQQNPFPQIAKMEYHANVLRVQSLGAEPIPNIEFIKQVLVGFNNEFIALCCEKFMPGKVVKFSVMWDE